MLRRIDWERDERVGGQNYLSKALNVLGGESRFFVSFLFESSRDFANDLLLYKDSCSRSSDGDYASYVEKGNIGSNLVRFHMDGWHFNPNIGSVRLIEIVLGVGLHHVELPAKGTQSRNAENESGSNPKKSFRFKWFKAFVGMICHSIISSRVLRRPKHWVNL